MKTHTENQILSNKKCEDLKVTKPDSKHKAHRFLQNDTATAFNKMVFQDNSVMNIEVSIPRIPTQN